MDMVSITTLIVVSVNGIINLLTVCFSGTTSIRSCCCTVEHKEDDIQND